MSLLNKHIFISKTPSEVEDLQKMVKISGGTLTATPLIFFEEIPFKEIPTTDIIFFSSPRGVKYFFGQCRVFPKAMIACVGNTTAKALDKLGLHPSFIGNEEHSIEEVADSFRSFAGKNTVLFPVSDITLGTISSILDPLQAIQFPVYRTILAPAKIEGCDVYVFSSPSNVRSFFELNTIPINATVIAWGNSTSKELELFGVSSKKLGTPSLKCLIQLLNDH